MKQVTKVPGVVDFLEGMVNQALMANLVWPRADVRDMENYERDRSAPPTGRLRVTVLGTEALPPAAVMATAAELGRAADKARRWRDSLVRRRPVPGADSVSFLPPSEPSHFTSPAFPA